MVPGIYVGYLLGITWVPVFRYVRQLLDQGYLGLCFHCYMRYVGDYGRAGQYGWRFEQHRSNGILGDLGVHMIDLARWYVGDISKVCGHLTTFIEREGSDLATPLYLRMTPLHTLLCSLPVALTSSMVASRPFSRWSAQADGRWTRIVVTPCRAMALCIVSTAAAVAG
jgi:predicted dehydrogenase